MNMSTQWKNSGGQGRGMEYISSNHRKKGKPITCLRKNLRFAVKGKGIRD